MIYRDVEWNMKHGKVWLKHNIYRMGNIVLRFIRYALNKKIYILTPLIYCDYIHVELSGG